MSARARLRGLTAPWPTLSLPAVPGLTAHPYPPGVPEALDTCLREDACVRADARQLKLELEQTQSNAVQAREATALPGRLLAALGRRKGGPSTPEEAAAIFARENVLRRQCAESERLQQHYTTKLDALVTSYLQSAVPVFLEQSRARVRLSEWERLIVELRTDLRELIKMLGQARNNAVAGNEQGTRLRAKLVQELFDQSSGLIRSIDAKVRQANLKAREIGGLPGITIIPLQETITKLATLEVVPMLREFDRVVHELELFEQRQLVDLQVPAVATADAQVAKAQAYLVQYREQLRAHYDKQVTPDEIAQSIPDIIERFRRG